MPKKPTGGRAGRPSPYKPEFAARARELCEAGAIEPELAAEFGVDRRTITNWEQRYSEFRDAIKVGKGAADERVKRSLYERAIGYTFKAVKIFMPAGAKEPVIVPYDEHVPPDPVAQKFWLMNRCPEEFREKTYTEHAIPDELVRKLWGA